MSLLHRGDVVALPPPRGAKGHEQKGRRYAVVVQSAAFDWLATVLVAPTSTGAQPAIFRPEIRRITMGNILVRCQTTIKYIKT